MTKKNTKVSNRNDANLDSRYGEIGISAVAAALQFKRETKNPACAPAADKADEKRFPDLAA